jgi:hypothetical protein
MHTLDSCAAPSIMTLARPLAAAGLVGASGGPGAANATRTRCRGRAAHHNGIITHGGPRMATTSEPKTMALVSPRELVCMEVLVAGSCRRRQWRRQMELSRRLARFLLKRRRVHMV